MKVTPKEANHHHGHEIKKRNIKIRKGPNLQQKKKSVMEKIERDREGLYRKWKEPQGKIPSMSLLIFSKRSSTKEIFLAKSTPPHRSFQM